MDQQAGIGNAVDVFAGNFQIVNRLRSGADFDRGDSDCLTKRRTQSFTGLQLLNGRRDQPLAGRASRQRRFYLCQTDSTVARDQTGPRFQKTKAREQQQAER